MASRWAWIRGWGRWRRPDGFRPGWERRAVVEAYEEWQTIEQYFQQVADPDLIDHAIYLLKAAEEKYHICLGRVRKTGA